MIAATGPNKSDQDTAALIRLLAALTGIADALGELRTARLRVHQAETAKACAALLRTYAPPTDLPRQASPPADRLPAPEQHHAATRAPGRTSNGGILL